MPQTIKLKRSAVANQVPTTGQLDLGEMAINTNDGKLFIRKSNGTTDVIMEIKASLQGTSSKVTTSTVSPTDPAPVTGDLWFDSLNNRLKYYNGTSWKEVASELEDLTVYGDTILGDNAATDTLTVNAATTFTGTGGVVVPSGTSGQRSPSTRGTIRYNTDTSSFEGYNGSSWGSLGGVKDVDQDTYILTESSPGADEDTFTFVTGGTTVGTWNSTTNTIKTNTAIDSGRSFTFGQGGNRRTFTDTRSITVTNESGTTIFSGGVFV